MVTTISALPTVPSRAERPATFSPEADAFWGALPQFRTELNQLAADLVAFTSGLDFNGTSSSSVTIGTGAKTFTTQSGKLWQVGQFVIVARTSAPANYMYGQVTSYSGTSLEVNVTATGGSGTGVTDWSIGLAAVGGITAAGTETLTNKTIDLTDNTVSGTLAEFNAACSNADFAPVGSPTFTGTPAAPTAAAGTNTTQIATTAFVEQATRANFALTPTGYRTLSSTTAAQALFDSTRDTATLAAGLYEFRCGIYLTDMSATSGNFDFSLRGAGSAAIGEVFAFVIGSDVSPASGAGAGPTTLSGMATGGETTFSIASIVTGGTATAAAAIITGIFEVNTGGTIIPSVALATAAAARVQSATYFTTRRLGDAGTNSSGFA